MSDEEFCNAEIKWAKGVDRRKNGRASVDTADIHKHGKRPNFVELFVRTEDWEDTVSMPAYDVKLVNRALGFTPRDLFTQSEIEEDLRKQGYKVVPMFD